MPRWLRGASRGKKVKTFKALLIATSVMASVITIAPASAATTVDFAGLEEGTAVPSRGGVTFQLSGGPGALGNPVITNYDGFNALSNSTTTFYPTSQYLDAIFSGSVANLSFLFTNYGSSFFGRGATTYSAYNSADAVVSAGFLGSTSGNEANIVSGTGITRLRFDNNTGGSESWIFGLRSLTFDAAPAGAVPEPATWAMMILGMGAVGFAMRRRIKVSEVSFTNHVRAIASS